MNGWRYPDKPMPGTVSVLADLGKGWVAEPKVDGWRCVVHRTAAGVEAWTRHRKRLGEVLGRPCDLPASLERQLQLLPSGQVLDAEWVGSRTGAKEERLFIFDLLRMDQAWAVHHQRDFRRAFLEDLASNWEAPLHLIPEGEPLRVWSAAQGGRLACWWPRHPRLVEGIVVKRRNSLLVLGSSRSRENPAWLKVKLEGR